MSSSSGRNSSSKLISTSSLIGEGHCTIAEVTCYHRSVGITTEGPALQRYCRSESSLADSKVGSGFSALIICSLSNRSFDCVSSSGTGNGSAIRSATLDSVGISHGSITGITTHYRSISICTISPTLQSYSRRNCCLTNSEVSSGFSALIVSSLSDCSFHSVGSSGTGNGCTIRSSSLNSISICYRTITSVTRYDWSISLAVICPALQSNSWGYCSLANSKVSGSFSALIVGSFSNCSLNSVCTSSCRNGCTIRSSSLNSVGICYSTITSVTRNDWSISLTVICPALQSYCRADGCLANSKVSGSFSALIVSSLSNRGFNCISTSGRGNGSAIRSSPLNSISICYCTITCVTTHYRSISICTISPTLQRDGWCNCSFANRKVGCSLCTLIVSCLSNRSFDSIGTCGTGNS